MWKENLMFIILAFGQSQSSEIHVVQVMYNNFHAHIIKLEWNVTELKSECHQWQHQVYMIQAQHNDEREKQDDINNAETWKKQM